MKAFMKSLKNRLYITVFYCIFIIITSAIGINRLLTQNDDFYSLLIACNIGFSIGIFITMLYYCYEYFTCIRNSQKCKALYIKETDERSLFIETKTGGSPLIFLLFSALLAMLIALYINLMIYITLLITVIFIASTKIILYCYYNRVY